MTFSVKEGEDKLIHLVATANPPEIEYKFSKKDRVIDMENEALLDARVTAKPDGTLNVKMARREDAGMYKVRASNSEGKTNLKFKLDVQYAPT